MVNYNIWRKLIELLMNWKIGKLVTQYIGDNWELSFGKSPKLHSLCYSHIGLFWLIKNSNNNNNKLSQASFLTSKQKFLSPEDFRLQASSPDTLNCQGSSNTSHPPPSRQSTFTFPLYGIAEGKCSNHNCLDLKQENNCFFFFFLKRKTKKTSSK